MGNKYKPRCLPLTINTEMFKLVQSAALDAGLSDANLLGQYYVENSNCSSTRFCLRNETSGAIRQDIETLIKLIDFGTRVAIREGRGDGAPVLQSAVHHMTNKALQLIKDGGEKDSERVIAVVRRFEGALTTSNGQYFDGSPGNSSPTNLDSDSEFDMRTLIEDLICGVSKSNLHFFR